MGGSCIITSSIAASSQNESNGMSFYAKLSQGEGCFDDRCFWQIAGDGGEYVLQTGVWVER